MVNVEAGSVEDQLVGLLWNYKWAEAQNLIRDNPEINFTSSQFLSILRHLIQNGTEGSRIQYFNVLKKWLKDTRGNDFALDQWKLIIANFRHMRYGVVRYLSGVVLSSLDIEEELYEIFVRAHIDMYGSGALSHMLNYVFDLEQMDVDSDIIIDVMDQIFSTYDEIRDSDDNLGLPTISRVILEWMSDSYLELLAQTGRTFDIPYDEIFRYYFDHLDVERSQEVNNYFMTLQDSFNIDIREPFTVPYEKDGETFNSPREYIVWIMETYNIGSYADVLDTIDNYHSDTDGATNEPVGENNNSFYEALFNHDWITAKQLLDESDDSIGNFTSEQLTNILQDLLDGDGGDPDIVGLAKFFEIMNEFQLFEVFSSVDDFTLDQVELLIKGLEYMLPEDQFGFAGIVVNELSPEDISDGYKSIVSTLVSSNGTYEFLSFMLDADLAISKIDDLFTAYEELYVQSEGELPPLIDVVLEFPSTGMLETYLDTGRQISDDLKTADIYVNYIENQDIEDIDRVIWQIRSFYEYLGVGIRDKFSEPYDGFETPLAYFLDYFSDEPYSLEKLEREANFQ